MQTAHLGTQCVETLCHGVRSPGVLLQAVSMGLCECVRACVRACVRERVSNTLLF